MMGKTKVWVGPVVHFKILIYAQVHQATITVNITKCVKNIITHITDYLHLL